METFLFITNMRDWGSTVSFSCLHGWLGGDSLMSLGVLNLFLASLLVSLSPQSLRFAVFVFLTGCLLGHLLG